LISLNHNLYTDISGQFVSGSEDSPEYKKEIIKEINLFLDIPGVEDRILFGTDFPIQSYFHSIELVENLGVSQEIRDKIYYKNARKILGLINNST
jgi:predicted TIM-barrel fold metal-dependent hydrolase